MGRSSRDVEAWVQLGEVLSHYSHVTGRSLAEARPAWERVLELEPDLALALWHLVRIEAQEKRTEALRATVERLLELTPEAERVHALRALRAFVGGDAAERERVLAALEGAADTVVPLVAWSLALVTDDGDGVAAIAAELTRPRRSAEAQGLGHTILAYVAAGAGRWQAAHGHLAAAERAVPHLGLEHRAYLSSFDHLPVPREELAELRRRLEAWDAAAVPPSELPLFFFAGTDGLHPAIRLFLLGLIEARLGDERALERAAALEAASAASSKPAVVGNLAQAVRAAWWRGRGDDERALAALAGLDGEGVSYQDAFTSPFFSLPHERYLHGALAARHGEPEAARRWLSSLAEVSFYDDALVPLARLSRAELAESAGDRERAAAEYRAFLALWAAPDPELASPVERARTGLARLENRPSSP